MRLKRNFKTRLLGQIILALFTAQYILLVPQQHPLVELLHDKGYQIASLFSTVIAFLLIVFSVYLNQQLNLRLPWDNQFWPRLCAQLTLNLGGGMALDLLLVWFYFWIFHQDFLHSRYPYLEGQIVLWMLLSLNFFLVIDDALQENLKMKEIRLQDREFIHFICGCRGNKKVRIALDEIVCLYHESHYGYAYLINGEKWNTNYTLKVLEKQLAPCFGFKINRSVMVSWQAIRGFESVGNVQAKVVLKYPLADDLNLRISRERFKIFKDFYVQRELMLRIRETY